MMEKKILTNQCNNCGAPLIQVKNGLYCEYCKTSYRLPQEFIDDFQKNEKEEDLRQVQENPAASYHQPNITQLKFRPSGRRILIAILGLAIGGILLLCGLTIKGFGKAEKSSTNNPDQQIEMLMYDKNSSAMPDENPADFIHNQQLSIGVMLNYISYDEFKMSVYVKNNSGRTIDTNLKTDQMNISNVNIEDTLGNQYSCNITDPFSGTLRPDDVRNIGNLYCTPGFVPPDVKYLDLNVTFTNWGTYDFQVPLDLDFQELEIRYNLTRYDDSFEIQPTFFATIPQYITIKYDDISVIDDNGNYYPLEFCDDHSTLGRESNMEEYFIALAERYSPGSFFYCKFSKPIPYEVNAITFIMNVRGKTFTHIFTTDTVQ